MPFRSEKQRRFMFKNHPEIAKRWTKEYGAAIQKKINEKKNENKEK